MAEFDERWKRLVAAARRADEPLAPFMHTHPAPRSERRSLVALAALLACVLLALVPWQQQVAELCEGASTDLVQLPARLPRPPRPPSGALALAALLDLSPFTKESPP